jgi:hypothetical protein
MRTRHEVDTSLRFDRQESQPETRDIEEPGLDPVPARNPRTRRAVREPYLASGGLEDAVNLAIALGRPLLLQGDPGAGKTRLAYAVAFALGLPLARLARLGAQTRRQARPRACQAGPPPEGRYARPDLDRSEMADLYTPAR